MSPQVDLLCQTMHRVTSIGKVHKAFAMKCLKAQVVGQRVGSKAFETARQWTFLGGSSVVLQSDLQRSRSSSKGFAVSASWLTSSQLASKAFTWGTVAVLPFYTLMVLAPSAALTRRATESNLPFVVLGVVYAYLLFLSWTPDTMRLLFASKYWLPELTGISKMFLNEMTMASAWIHLLAVDLYAARQVFQDGMKNNIETRHSVSLCLFFCPVGILTHVVTKVLTKTINRSV